MKTAAGTHPSFSWRFLFHGLPARVRAAYTSHPATSLGAGLRCRWPVSAIIMTSNAHDSKQTIHGSFSAHGPSFQVSIHNCENKQCCVTRNAPYFSFHLQNEDQHKLERVSTFAAEFLGCKPAAARIASTPATAVAGRTAGVFFTRRSEPTSTSQTHKLVRAALDTIAKILF